MATVTELYNSRRTVDGDSHERVYRIEDAADEAAAITAVEAAAPTTANGLNRSTVTVESLDGTTTWTSTVLYKPSSASGMKSWRKPIPLSGVVLSGTTTGATERITHSRSTEHTHVPAGDADLDFQQAIGVSDNGVEGVDIVVPAFRFQATKAHPSTSLPSLSTIYSLTGTVNDASVSITDTESGASMSFSAGELLFEGADWSNQRFDGGLEVTYQFAARPNRTNIVIGDITVAAKLGWEYLWVHYIEVEDTTGKRLVHRPRAAFVEQVYASGDFSGLGL